MQFEPLTRHVATDPEADPETRLAVRSTHEMAARDPVSDAEWRLIPQIRSRPCVWLPHDRPRSVALPAGLLALAICGAPFLVFLLAEVLAR